MADCKRVVFQITKPQNGLQIHSEHTMQSFCIPKCCVQPVREGEMPLDIWRKKKGDKETSAGRDSRAETERGRLKMDMERS
ncbi:uncharacterized protein LOC118379307 isoform X4 [Oncorhynchus keta]|uniref:uncharacterized protein LOC118379307 isoform X4 n=1 Tax=Oncorhynchus keta TaxID=8018 RepID=UPI00227AC300|nr:uncharacterized protein LOC118379307 isoform X4 [Oncorhynchus keta]